MKFKIWLSILVSVLKIICAMDNIKKPDWAVEICRLLEFIEGKRNLK